MCGGVYFIHNGVDQRVYFPNPTATLPVVLKNKEQELIPWGRREKQAGKLPLGGWARLDSVYAGKWDRYHPKPVKIQVKQFMEKDHEGNSHWFDVLEGQYIQGLIAKMDNERRVYVVTVTPELPEAIHNRWPRILSARQ